MSWMLARRAPPPESRQTSETESPGAGNRPERRRPATSGDRDGPEKRAWESPGYTPPAVIERDERVRAHLGASTFRPRMTASSAPRCSGVRMFPDMSLPVSCFDRSFPGQMDRSANHVNP